MRGGDLHYCQQVEIMHLQCMVMDKCFTIKWADLYRDNLGGYHSSPMGHPLMANASESTHLDHAPYKRMRLSGDTKTDLSQPLKIDTRAKEPIYTPQVEAISPTPGDRDADDSPSRSTKDELLQQISKVDRDIATAESSVLKLKRKQQELEESALKSEAGDVGIEAPKSRHRSLAQIIYSDNRKKAFEAHSLFAKLGPVVEFPLYNQPQDMLVYHDNVSRYSSFRPLLIEFLKKQKKEVEESQSKKMAAYTNRLNLWMKRVDRIERGISPPPYDPNPPIVPGGITFTTPVLPKKRERDQRNREIFEKVFPELRKQREDKERLSRAGSRIKSDADLEEIMDGLQEQENEDKKMRSLAVVPPLMLEGHQRRIYYDNTNGIVEDPMEGHRERQLLNVWTEQEKDIFKEKYLQHPKGFALVKTFLERKSIPDCVHYYYISKKTENYKQLLRKSRARTRARTVQKSQQQQDLSVGVTTRLQREALLKQGETSTMTSTAVIVQSESVEVTEVKTVEGGMDKELAKEEVEKTGEANVEAVDSVTVEQVVKSIMETENLSVVASEAGSSISVCQETDLTFVEVKLESTSPQLAREEEATKTAAPVSGSKEAMVTCAICHASVSHASSRSLLKKDAAMFGLKETEIIEGSRVCVKCRCNGVRRRTVHCPVSTCPTPKRRVKRLRALPSKWLEMSPEAKAPIISELQIPSDASRVCAACVNRISRRAGLFDSCSESSEPSRRDSEADDSEGSSTSSNEEEVPEDRLQINETPDVTCKAEILKADIPEVKSEHVNISEPQAPPPLKDDYDSSETISADECQGQLDMEEAPRASFPTENNIGRTFTPPISSSQHQLQIVQNQYRPSRPGSKESISIKDIMHGVIERSIKRNDLLPSPTTRPMSTQVEPTITSILKDSQSFVNQRPEPRSSLASDQVRISSPQFPPQTGDWQHPHIPSQRDVYPRESVHREQHFIPPRDEKRPLDSRKPIFPNQPLPREGINIVVTECKDDEQSETLDLSIKRDRDSVTARPQVQSKPVSVPHRSAVNFVRQPMPLARDQEPIHEKAHSFNSGSITQGTPVSVDKSRKNVVNTSKEMPLQTVVFDHRTGQYVYLTERDRFLVAPQPREQRKPSPGRSMTEHSKGSSRESMLYNDYILSQQMIRKERELPRHSSLLSTEHVYLDGGAQQTLMQSHERKPEHYPQGYPPVSHYSHPTPGSKNIHHRQGVIQHTPAGPMRFPQSQIPKSGANSSMQLDFSSFVDVIASQPSLPVPDKKEKERPTPLTNPVPAHRVKSTNGELEKDRHWPPHEREPQRLVDDKDHQVTAASLIDAIVTHQMVSGISRGEKLEGERLDRMFQRYSKESKAQESYRAGVHEMASKPITLGEHIDSIITKDFARPGFESEQSYHAYVSGAWRERDPRADPRNSVPQHTEKDIKPGHLSGLRAPAPISRASPSEAPSGSRPHSQIPERHLIPDRHAQIPDRHLQLPDRHPTINERHLQIERHPHLSERSIQLERHYPERHGLQEQRHSLQDRHHLGPERHSQMQERHTQIVERHPQLSERHHLMMRPATPQGYHLARERIVQEQIKESWQAQRRPLEKSSPQVFDYVKNKIAEVMRTSEDVSSDNQDKNENRPSQAPSPSKRPRLEEDKARQSPFQRVEQSYVSKSRPSPNAQNPPSPYQSVPNYPYSYGAMAVRHSNPSQSPSAVNPAHRSQPPSPAPAPPVSAHVSMPSSVARTTPSPHSRQVNVNVSSSAQKEPAPILSAQYEPLSDED
ncbi:nuclear receptor corepressor 1-like isoform X2 [Artemia franciscana]|uniref:nuclear receptor corepressor 1-like isoform X2 n=1 Tax=Artemia franciscana TaxID=6661 RepID=UPI0032DB7525